MVKITLPKGLRGVAYQEAIKQFAEALIELDNTMPHKVSARGWCYLLEGMNLISKDQFNYVQKLINDKCRKEGLLPIDFVAQDKAREFTNVEGLSKDTQEPEDYLIEYLEWVNGIHKSKDDIAFWQEQEYYIQMTVEKIDIKNLFEPICEKYHIPIANMKGWSDMNSRNEVIQRYIEAESMGLKPVMLYYGDFDPAGILIAKNFKKNLDDLQKATGWISENLIFDFFGLTYDFIEEYNLTWIDSLTTGSGRDLGKLYDKHLRGEKTNLLPYEIEYIKKYGKCKCEANAVLPIANIAEEHCENKILEYLTTECFEKYNDAIKKTQDETKEVMEKVEYKERIKEIIDDIKALKEND